MSWVIGRFAFDLNVKMAENPRGSSDCLRGSSRAVRAIIGHLHAAAYGIDYVEVSNLLLDRRIGRKIADALAVL
jgi:hypothetical protein